MKIMCDTNVIIDVLLDREPFVDDSYKVLKLREEHQLEGFVSASSVTDIYYLVRKYTHSTAYPMCRKTPFFSYGESQTKILTHIA